MKVVVAIPWRPSPGRMAAYYFVRSHYSQALPEAQVVEADTDHDPYNLAAVRNKCVREAEAEGADVVVLADADCVIVPVQFLCEAINACAEDGRVHMPFTNQMYLSEQESLDFMAAGAVNLGGWTGNGACYVMSPAAYWACGGSDERFSGWGGDDDQFVAAASTLVGLTRHKGTAISLWHPAYRDVGSERHRPNAELAARYWAAKGNPRAMRAIISERDA